MISRGARLAIPAVLLLGILAVAGTAGAQTSEGALLTNVATASYFSPDGGYYTITYNSTRYVLVMSPAIQLYKSSNPTQQCTGGTVTFCVTARNSSAMTSAFNVVIEDKMPGDNISYGFAYLTGQTNWATTTGSVITLGYKYCVGAGCPSVGTWNPFWGAEPLQGQLGPYYLRWGVNMIGPGRSVQVCFKATVW